jgi:RNA polymerase sigma-70 factor (ECF subfamily)
VTLDESYLLSRARAGDARALGCLLEKHRRRVTRHVRRLVRQPGDAEDVVQETFIRAWRGLRAFRGESSFYSWLYRIATNAALAFRKRAKCFQPLEDASLQGLDSGPEERVIARQASETLERAMALLRPEQARALSLYEVEGMSYQDIAHALGVPIGTVRTLIFRARRSLQAALERPAPGPARRVSSAAPRYR